MLWSFSSLSFKDKQVFDVLVKKYIRPNLDKFDLSMLVLCLSSCLKLDYQRKSIEHIYEHIITREGELPSLSSLFLIVLLKSASKVQILKPEFIERVV